MAGANAALIENGVVANVIVVSVDDSGAIQDLDLSVFDLVVLPEGSPVQIGYSYNGTTFAPPTP